MSDYEKPPLGVAPTYISASVRIKNLAQAIVNYSDRADLERGHIYLWASEILEQIELIRKSESEWVI